MGQHSVRRNIIISLTFLGFLGCNIIGSTGKDSTLQFSSKEPIGFNISDLDYIKNQLKKEGNIYENAYNNLLVEANKALNSYGYSVVTKEGNAPNGDKHEYVSRGRYWWPDPDTEDGLPYIKKDGQVNPEIYQFDRTSLSNLRDDIRKLSIAYYLSGEEKYAQKAIALLKQWFINKNTKMKPNMRYAQGIPGLSTGRPAGIIEGIDFYRILNFVPILSKSNHWSVDIDIGLTNWYKQLYRWLQNHEFAKAEKKASNNHGTWYDVQVAAYAYFLGDDKKLTEVLKRVKTKRIPEQIEDNGQMPYEINRTQPLSYSIYNLEAFTILANLSKMGKASKLNATSSEDTQFWSYESEESGSIAKAVQYIVPYLRGEQSLRTTEQSSPENFNTCDALPVLKRSFDHFNRDIYKNTYSSIIEVNSRCRESISLILYPIEEIN